jgi:virulence factor Mce-like protein
MQRQAPTLGRMLVMVGFALSCFGLLLFLWLAFGGPIPLKPKGYRVEVSFAEAAQLAVEADVRISGVPVGKVKAVEPDPGTGRSRAVLEIDPDHVPLARGTRAILRQKTLLGETYVELSPGDPRRGALRDGEALPAGQVSETVELDEIFRTFDPDTRRAFQTWMQQQARAVDGRARDISDALGNLDPFAEDTTALLRALDTQQNALRHLVRSTGEVFAALSERRGQLQGLIRNADEVFTTTAARDRQLRELFTVLPTFNRETRATIDRLTRFARDTDPLVTQLRPAARELAPTSRQLERLAPDLNALFRDLDPLITASERGLPALERFLGELRPALGAFDPTLKQLNPILSWLGTYRDELRAFFANATAATQATTPDGLHYLRTLNPLNPENLAVYPRRIGSNRTNPYMKPRGYDALARGLPSYDTRQCGNGNPTVPPADELAALLREQLPSLQQAPAAPAGPLAAPRPDALTFAQNIIRYVFDDAGRDIPAPRCVSQGPFTVEEGVIRASGEVTTYPHVREAASSTRAPSR